jgi:hypothetical protein
LRLATSEAKASAKKIISKKRKLFEKLNKKDQTTERRREERRNPPPIVLFSFTPLGEEVVSFGDQKRSAAYFKILQS